MISFRYHLVSLVAVLLALAAGIAVGSGPLQRSSADDSAAEANARALQTAQQRLAESGEALSFSDGYARATAAEVVDGALSPRAVTLVTLPGADEGAVETITDMVEQAGGSVTARVALSEELLDVANRQLVAELAAQMHASVKGSVDVPAGASGYERMALLLAHATTSPRTRGSSVDEAGDSILAGLSTANLATTRGDVDRRGSLVVAVAGAPYGSADVREGAGSILATMLTALDSESDGVVLAGPVSAAAEDGLVGALRGDPTAAEAVSTVDVADRVAGAVVTVLALRAEAAGRSGHYGTSAAADGPVPGGNDG